MTQLTFLPAPLNACAELTDLFNGCHGPEEREQFRTFVADYWLALGEHGRNGQRISYPPSWLPIHLQRITNALHRYADKLGHRVVFDRPLVENPLDKGVPGIEVTEFLGKPAKSIIEETFVMKSALDVQVGGGHYKEMKIQPVEYIHANKIQFLEGSVIKYVSRWRNKNGLEDLKKARHFLDLLIQLEFGNIGDAGDAESSGNKN